MSSSDTVPAVGNTSRVLFLGAPTDDVEVEYWAGMRRWARAHGFDPTDSLDEGSVACVVTTEDILDGFCHPTESVMVQQLHENHIPFVSAYDDPRILQRVLACTAAAGAVTDTHPAAPIDMLPDASTARSAA
ncbi:hypothetical protein ACFTWF_16985 [Rhodococcus sp. NPDC056960]|uniref:hypothetical protein n=1 Tax=Rhodococcus sp. NPDC056960 TaxID=3345982 RepID=UPI0036353146